MILRNKNGTIKRYDEVSTKTVKASYDEDTALYAHAVGDFIYLNEHFYKVTVAIAVGDTIEDEVNVTSETGLSVDTPIYVSNMPGSEQSDAGGDGLSYDTSTGKLSLLDGNRELSFAIIKTLFSEFTNNSGFHNSIYRGKSLGSEVTVEQYAAIVAGTFEDMYIGDYWTIGGVNYRIAAFDYWLHTGDTECTTHHVVIVPDTNLYDADMNDSNITTGAYVGSKMYITNLAQAKTIINSAFGASHILNHREYLANAMKSTEDPTYESAESWYDSTVELMNERMVYGADIFHNVGVNGAIPASYTIDKSQLALFALEPSRICNRALWWLRCAVSAGAFAIVDDHGNADCTGAGHAFGVRPVFGIKAAA